ncbi:hypothetical protein EUTSA_v10007600mg [Eutrema salsugineum]|uniref:F-box domain-containing protein n=1 Tax=Eutrema salsugineum TaxID=72664 RepID=V4KZH3_EUTSA|nr:FBD-associated F-box protein At5g27750 [Eutrema salsugineum]ESQ35442.1 hypothetical protein EUTSA_v10007600mg [Eutrema salsugineum]
MPGFDRISELPEFLLTQILSYLPTKDSVKTSVLATRWKNLWLNVPVLDIDCSDFPYKNNQVFFSFIDKFLEINQSRLPKVKIKCMTEEIFGIQDRIGEAINRGTQHLDVESSTFYVDPDTLLYPCVEYMPLNLYTSKTLVSLKLSYSGLEDPGFVSMPCLKSITFEQVQLRANENLEKIILGCPVLEELTLLRDIDGNFQDHDDPFLRVKSWSLKRFIVPLSRDGCDSRGDFTLEIDAPGLEHMSLREDHFDRIVVKNLTSLFMVDLDVKFLVKFGTFFSPGDLSKRKEIRDFLTGISRVGHMIISTKTVKALTLYSKGGMIPKFNNLHRLEAEFPGDLLQVLPALLESCPNLKHLTLTVVYTEENEVFELRDVPRCFLSTLECVEIKRVHEWEEKEMKVATYFLENAAVLKKLILSVTDYPRYVSDSEIYEELCKVTKRSPSCRIILDWELC